MEWNKHIHAFELIKLAKKALLDKRAYILILSMLNQKIIFGSKYKF
jgi:hypothetical protein